MSSSPRIVLLLLGVLLAGCGRGTPVLPVLRVGTSGDYAPFSLDGRGFDVDVAAELSRDLGYRVEWVPFRWRELQQGLESGHFDLAMSGVTWQPDRDVIGWSSRAVAAGGPCLLGRADGPPLDAAARIAVNRGGFLERWSRQQFGERVQATDDNRSLPGRLARKEVDAIVTDRFELASFVMEIPGDSPPRVECTPPRFRKVYWVSPARAGELGPAIDAWIAAHEPELERLRERWWGTRDPRDELDHLVDLLARRLAFMPAVAAAKQARDLPIEDPAQEERVLEGVERAASERGLDPRSLRDLFRVQIELSKALQARAARPAPALALDLETQIRPALARLGDRIADSLAVLAPIELARLRPTLDVLLGEWLDSAEIDALELALRGVRRAGADTGRQDSEVVLGVEGPA